MAICLGNTGSVCEASSSVLDSNCNGERIPLCFRSKHRSGLWCTWIARPEDRRSVEFTFYNVALNIMGGMGRGSLWLWQQSGAFVLPRANYHGVLSRTPQDPETGLSSMDYTTNGWLCPHEQKLSSSNCPIIVHVELWPIIMTAVWRERDQASALYHYFLKNFVLTVN